MLHAETGRYKYVACKCRLCPVCGPEVWKPIKLAQVFKGMGRVPLERLKLVTVTAPGGQFDCAVWNEEAPRRVHNLLTALRRALPADLEVEYIKVAELQERGAIHYHIVIRTRRRFFLAHAMLKELAQQVGFGSVCWVDPIRVEKGGVRGAIAYLGKYLLKAVMSWPGRQLVVTRSRSWTAPEGVDLWENRRPLVGSSGWQWCATLRAVHRAWFEVLFGALTTTPAMSEARARASGREASAPW